MYSVLVVDDDDSVREFLKELFVGKYEVFTASNGQQALKAASQHEPDVMILDIRMPGMSGIEVLEKMSSVSPKTQVIMGTADTDLDQVVKAIKLGAFDYKTKPFDFELLSASVEKALERLNLLNEVENLRFEVSTKYFKDIVGESEPMKKIYDIIERIKNTDASVIIYGESGTGKELVARAIHYGGARAVYPFVAVNCAAIPPNLLESELFGHERGSFTGATMMRRGKFEVANKGTLFLDEIGNMSFELQSKLLRVLQDQRFERVGGNTEISVDVRIISATNADLQKLIEDNKFREDLYYRLHVVPINIPPLRKRQSDIPLLVSHFINKYSPKLGKKIMRIDKEAMDILTEYRWPGNVRELENVIERSIVLSDSEIITASALPKNILDANDKENINIASGKSLDEAEKLIVEKTLSKAKGNKTKAAEILGITRKTLRNKIERYGIDA